MLIGVPREIKTKEFRVGLTPSGVSSLVLAGHQVIIETDAGIGSGLLDSEYVQAGAQIVPDKETLWANAQMVVKVKEPIEPEYALMREGQLLFTYLHLAAAQPLGHQLIERKVNAVAYETIETPDRRLPLLIPMSAVAGRMSVQAGASILEKERGGKGILLGGVPGVRRSKVTVIGGGIVGSNATKIAVGFGAEVTVLDINTEVLAYLDDIYQGKISTLYSDPLNIAKCVAESDLVIGAVLVTGARAPQLVTRHDQDHEPWLGHRRRRCRSRWMCRDLSPDDPCRSDLCRGRCRSLLRRQHARRRAIHLDLRSDQRDPALCARARWQRTGSGRSGRSRCRPRHQHLQRDRAARGGCRRSRCASYTARTIILAA